MAVPFVDLKRFESGFLDRWMEKVSTMSSTASFIGGSEVAKLEVALCERLRVAYTVSCANGTDALQLALRAMGVGAGDVVLVPDVTFWATFEAVVNVGASPVTLDVDPEDGGVDLTSIIRAIDNYAPKAAIIAHLYGWGSTQLKAIRQLCTERGVMLLEDGAQCYGVEYNGNSIYQDALISTTSFYPAKVLGAAGDGGAVFTNNPDLADRVRQLSNHGRTQHYGYASVGWNSRMDSLQAAFVNLSLDHIEQRLASRRQSAEYYRQQLRGLPLRVMDVPEGYVENGYCNVCHLEAPLRAMLEAVLKAEGIGFGNIYPGALSAQPGAEGYIHAAVSNGRAAEYCTTVLNLPLFPYMTADELEAVVAVVKKTLV
ncbi:DegT/DnrJ/EryC1/StrS family aminotransferase [Dechloromonas sp. ARDL1]|uniref:DegT/DnrJ/EryC1/StrS family aminotransferase n=1 Tax=Dechloromonas sp. ARDL1 TaxID=3322121 RepID=UPI003DA73383